MGSDAEFLNCRVRVEVRTTAFNPWQELADPPTSCGATAVFVGRMRDLSHGETVSAMWLEHYPGMTEKHINRVCNEAIERWKIDTAHVVHRVGTLAPGDPIVLVAVSSAHRDNAFAACRYIIDELKTRAPFWKKERTGTGERWILPA